MSPDSPLSPVRFPATENDWQGLPPMTTSALPSYSFQSTSRMSPTFAASGTLFSKTALQ